MVAGPMIMSGPIDGRPDGRGELPGFNGALLDRLIQQRGLSRSELARRVRTKPDSIRDWITGRRQPQERTVRRLARELDVAWTMFYEESSNYVTDKNPGNPRPDDDRGHDERTGEEVGQERIRWFRRSYGGELRVHLYSTDFVDVTDLGLVPGPSGGVAERGRRMLVSSASIAGVRVPAVVTLTQDIPEIPATRADELIIDLEAEWSKGCYFLLRFAGRETIGRLSTLNGESLGWTDLGEVPDEQGNRVERTAPKRFVELIGRVVRRVSVQDLPRPGELETR